MFPKDKQVIQELLIHPGWTIFKAQILGNPELDNKQMTSLKEQLKSREHIAARNGETFNAAYYAGQIDVLETIFEIPEKYLKDNRA